MELINLIIVVSTVLLLFILISPALSSAATATDCAYSINNSGENYTISASQCGSYDVAIPSGISGANILCSGSPPIVNISVGTGSRSDTFYNCSFSGSSRMILQNGSSVYIIGSQSRPAIFEGLNSSVTIGYYLRVNVLEPYGYNSSLFGDRVAGFGYIYPTFNGTRVVRQTELMPNYSSTPFINSTIKNLSAIVPFGAYNQSQTQIYKNITNLSYGRLIGSKTYKLAAYTVFNNRTVNYNPYSLVYSFFAYDQLIFFNFNISGNMNLTPIYVQPIFPMFNYYTIPDNGTHNITIRWLVAVPPQDTNWNFTTFLYRYNADDSFTVDPLSGPLGKDATVVKVLNYPNSSYEYTMDNGTKMYAINYNTKVPVAKNSSITISVGNAGRNISYIQDSTTPSFGFGLSFCASLANTTLLTTNLSFPGYYHSVPVVLPVSQQGPYLVNAPCNTTAYIIGKNIYLNCSGAVFNDQIYGIKFRGAKNVTVNGCRIYGNGVFFDNSSDIRLLNTTINVSEYNDSFAIMSANSQNISLSNITVSRGFKRPLIESNSTLYMSDVYFNSTVSYTTTTTALTTTIPQTTGSASKGRNDTILYAATVVTVLVYAALLLSSRRRRRPRAAKGRARRTR